MSHSSTRVVIAGSGFAGTAAAAVLAQADDIEVLLVDRNNEMAFIPMLYQVATASLAPQQITSPIRRRFRRGSPVEVLQAEVTGADFEQSCLWARSATALKLDYDYLILALGSQTRFLDVPGAAEHSWPMRTPVEAVALRDRILSCLNDSPAPSLASSSSTPPKPNLTFVIVGGGPTGVELAGALAQQLKQRGYGLGKTARIVLVQSGDRLLKSYPASSGRYAARWLRRCGIEVRLGERVSQVTAQEITLERQSQALQASAGEPASTQTITTQTVIWTAGLEGIPPDSPQTVSIDGSNRLKVLPTLQLQDYPQVYGVGDISCLVEQAEQLNGVAQEAIQQGRAAAQNILRQRSGQALVPFDYNDKGRLAIIGRGAGVGLIKGVSLNGPLGGWLAWLLWLEVHWFYLPSWRNRWTVLGSWLLARSPRSALSNLSSIHPHSGNPLMGIQSYFPLVGRTFLSSIFVYAGINNLLNFASTAERIGAMLPAPSLALTGNILCCLLGSISLILGFKVRWGTLLLIVFLLPTTLIFHPFWNDGSETIAFLKNFSLIGALLFVNFYGPGPISLDTAD